MKVLRTHVVSEFFGGVFLPGGVIDSRGPNRMKWCEVDRSRVSLLQSRRYPSVVASKSRRRHIARETKDRPSIMQHQLHVGYNNAQGGTIRIFDACSMRTTRERAADVETKNKPT